MTSTPPGGSYLTRSEERLTVGTEVVPVRRAVLRIDTTTEEVMVPVTITRQHARLEYIDVDPATALPVTQDLLPDDRRTGALSAWVTLTVDEPVVTTRPIPIERVRLVTEWITDQQVITADLAHEEITQDFPPAASPGQRPTS
jgi:hypothetical protein